jgi:glycolate oxidase iron-sulfur subunit
MQTNFTDAQLADPDTNASEKILRACVHCGFCTATCPTYVLLGDELDSPRGRIYLIKDMLENDRPATPEVVKHIDRCLSCLSCMTTCPSGVNYMHLVDHGRRHIEKTYRRPWFDRLLRRAFGIVLPNPSLFRASMWAARLGAPFAGLMPAQLKAALALVPSRLPSASVADKPQVFKSEGQRTRRVALLNGCEVVVAAGAGCCGALTHHLGQDAHEYARANILAWTREIANGGLDAIVINASGCGTTVKDYGFMFRNDPELAELARIVSSLTRDITELMSEIGLQAHVNPTGQRVAYHSACSLQHGQQIREQPKRLLKEAGFVVLDPPEGHLCCGSAGTYNLLQPEIARRLRDRKVANIGATSPDLIAAGNIGCLTQIASGTKVPVVHTVELLDWATGGPRPKASLKSFG